MDVVRRVIWALTFLLALVLPLVLGFGFYRTSKSVLEDLTITAEGLLALGVLFAAAFALNKVMED